MRFLTAIFVGAILCVSGYQSAFAAPVTYEGHSYEYISDSVSWLTAKKLAEDAGGYLACFETREELEFVQTNQSRRLTSWVGLTDAETEGRWKWINGADLDPSMISLLERGQDLGYRDYGHSLVQGGLGSRAEGGTLPSGWQGASQVQGYVIEWDTLLIASSASVAQGTRGGMGQETEIQTRCSDSAATESEQSSPVLRQGIQQQLAQIRTCLGTGDMDCAERGLEELEDADLRDDEPAALLISRGGYYSARDQLRRARGAYEEVLESSDAHPQLTHFAAVQAVAVNMRDDRSRQALEIAEEHFTCVDWTPDTLLMAADGYYERRDYAASLSNAERSIALLLVSDEPESRPGGRVRQFVLPARAVQLITEDVERLDLELADAAVRIAEAVAKVHPNFRRVRLYAPLIRYPRDALSASTSGYVVVGGTSAADGRTRDVVVRESSHGIFERPAINAVEQSIFLPMISGGNLVDSNFEFTVTLGTARGR